MIASTPSLLATGPPISKKRDYLSFSAIRTYQTCPLRYFFRYVAGLPDEQASSSLVFGAAIHSAIEHHFRELLAGNEAPTLQDLLDKYQDGWEERKHEQVRFGSGESQESLSKLAHRMLDAFQKSAHAQPHGHILAVEDEVRGRLVPGLPDLLAKVDLIVDSPNYLTITDWKTSRTRWSTEQVEESAAQLLLYSELVQDFAPGKPMRIQFVVLTKTKVVGIHWHALDVDRLQVARIKRVVEHVWGAIDSETFYPAPSPMNCGGCPFREPCRRWPG